MIHDGYFCFGTETPMHRKKMVVVALEADRRYKETNL